MDAGHPSVDYLRIDRLIRSGLIDEAHQYIKSIHCNLEDVMDLWYWASGGYGVLLFHKHYFDISMDSTNITFTESCDICTFGAGSYKVQLPDRTCKELVLRIPYSESIHYETKGEVLINGNRHVGYIVSCDCRNEFGLRGVGGIVEMRVRLE